VKVNKIKMADKKTAEPKVKLEREYIVPLRREWLKVPKYRRSSRAVKALKKFIARHMKLYDSDLRKVKIDQVLNNELRFRGMKKPPAKIKVRARKFDDIIRVELVEIPAHVKFKKLKEEKKKAEIEKKVKEKEEKKEEKEEKKEERAKGSESKDSESVTETKEQ
jgi:large subunit ribosomal protein L31e